MSNRHKRIECPMVGHSIADKDATNQHTYTENVHVLKDIKDHDKILTHDSE